MGCVCCSLSSFISILLDALERISLCTVCAMLTCCLLFTILTMMVLGIGIGYHYCFVQSAVDAMEKAAQASRGGGEHVADVRTIDRAIRKKSVSGHRVKRGELDILPPNNNTQLTNNTQNELNNTLLNTADASYNNTYYLSGIAHHNDNFSPVAVYRVRRDAGVMSPTSNNKPINDPLKVSNYSILSAVETFIKNTHDLTLIRRNVTAASL